jgi:hypothetical protein
MCHCDRYTAKNCRINIAKMQSKKLRGAYLVCKKWSYQKFSRNNRRLAN